MAGEEPSSEALLNLAAAVEEYLARTGLPEDEPVLALDAAYRRLWEAYAALGTARSVAEIRAVTFEGVT